MPIQTSSPANDHYACQPQTNQQKALVSTQNRQRPTHKCYPQPVQTDHNSVAAEPHLARRAFLSKIPVSASLPDTLAKVKADFREKQPESTPPPTSRWAEPCDSLRGWNAGSASRHDCGGNAPPPPSPHTRRQLPGPDGYAKKESSWSRHLGERPRHPSGYRPQRTRHNTHFRYWVSGHDNKTG